MQETTVARFLDAVAAREPAPGGGAVTAVSAAAGAALVAMAARFSEGLGDLVARMDAVRDQALGLAEADARAYGAVLDAQRLPAGTRARGERLRAALAEATDVPLAIARLAREVAEAAARVVADGNANLRGDAVAGGVMAAASARSAAHLVRLNAGAGKLGAEPVRHADRYRDEAEVAARNAEAGA